MARIGLVIGAGGIVGASYATGALEAIRRLTGWEATDADVVIGTSAGAFIGALSLSVPVWLMYGWCTGTFPRGLRATAGQNRLMAQLDAYNAGPWLSRFRPPLRLARPLLASPAAIARGLSDRALGTFAAGLAWEGVFSTRCIEGIIGTACPTGWPPGDLRVVTCDLEAGTRQPFTAADAELVRIEQAVAASSAIPGLLAPVVIGGRRYVDGGTWSANNLDLAAGLGLDAVIAISPMSGCGADPDGEPPGRWHRSLCWLDRQTRKRVGDALRGEALQVASSGTPVFLVEPAAGRWQWPPWVYNMDLTTRPAVMRMAAESVTASLQAPEAAWLLDALQSAAKRRPVAA